MTLPVFETLRLTLRSITEHDAEGLHEAYGDADAMRHWDLPPSVDVSQTAERIRLSAEADPRWHGMWAVQTHAGRFVGAINYHAHNEQQRRLALGWIVVPSCWRQGLMTEAAPPVISHCFTRLNAHRIEARIEPENVSSRRLAGKLRFTEEGLLRDWLCVAGEFRNVVNELCMEAARVHPDRFAILGNFPLDKPESRALVDTWKQRPGMLGCRFTFIGPDQSTWPTDGTVDWLWPAAERAGLPIAMMAANFLPKVGEVAQRHPNLKLILDHLGRPRGDTSSSERWANLADVLTLAKYPNIAMKATGPPSYSDQPYPFRDIHDNLHRLYDAFGPARWFWGTDITRMRCSWRQCVTLFTEELPWLKGRDPELVMAQAICDCLGWKRYERHHETQQAARAPEGQQAHAVHPH